MESTYLNEALVVWSSDSTPFSDDGFLLVLATLFLRICKTTNGRECNTLLESLYHRVGGLESFLRDFRTASSIRKKLQSQMKRAVPNSGFGKRTLRSSNEGEYTSYLISAADVTEEQVNSCDDGNISTTFGKWKKFLLILNAEISIHACTAVKHEVKSCKDLYVYQKREKYEGVVSTISSFQLFSEKLNATLSS